MRKGEERKEPPGLFRLQMACHAQSQPLNAAEMVSGKEEGECAEEAGMLTRSLAPLPLHRHTDVTPSIHSSLPPSLPSPGTNLLFLQSKKCSEGKRAAEQELPGIFPAPQTTYSAPHFILSLRPIMSTSGAAKRP